MSPSLKEQVRQRADFRCEYCRLPHAALRPDEFHIEHIIALCHGGSDHLDNLALACNRCNYFKGPNRSGIDPESGVMVFLFDPRKHNWTDHFKQAGARVVGLSPIGRATARLLHMNTPGRVELRSLIHDKQGRL